MCCDARWGNDLNFGLIRYRVHGWMDGWMDAE